MSEENITVGNDFGFIYKITNTTNGKIYVGQTRHSIEKRFAGHKTSAYSAINSQCAIHRAMRKYGIDSFRIEELESCPVEMLNEREIYWISYYDSYHNGYNLTIGGDGRPLYEVTDVLVEKILESYKTDHSVAATSRETGFTYTFIRTLLTKNKVPILTATEYVKEYASHTIYQYSLKTGKLINTFDCATDAGQYLVDNQLTRAKNAYNAGSVLRKDNIANKPVKFGFFWSNELLTEKEVREQVQNPKTIVPGSFSNKHINTDCVCHICGKELKTDRHILCKECAQKIKSEQSNQDFLIEHSITRYDLFIMLLANKPATVARIFDIPSYLLKTKIFRLYGKTYTALLTSNDDERKNGFWKYVDINAYPICSCNSATNKISLFSSYNQAVSSLSLKVQQQQSLKEILATGSENELLNCRWRFIIQSDISLYEQQLPVPDLEERKKKSYKTGTYQYSLETGELLRFFDCVHDAGEYLLSTGKSNAKNRHTATSLLHSKTLEDYPIHFGFFWSRKKMSADEVLEIIKCKAAKEQKNSKNEQKAQLKPKPSQKPKPKSKDKTPKEPKAPSPRLVCPVCYGPKSADAALCRKCAEIKRHEDSNQAFLEQHDLTYSSFKEMIRSDSFLHIGSLLGISDNAVKKHAAQFGLPTKKSDVAKYSDDEWEDEVWRDNGGYVPSQRHIASDEEIIASYEKSGFITAVSAELHCDAQRVTSVLRAAGIVGEGAVKVKIGKAVAALDDSGEVVGVYATMSDAEMAICGQKSHDPHIKAAIDGKRKKALGYAWRYATEDEVRALAGTV